MWTVNGERLDPPPFELLEPLEVLDEYDGPRLFTVRDRAAALHLAYSCGDFPEAARFIVVPTTASELARLSDGTLSLWSALAKPGQICVVDMDWKTLAVIAAWRVEYLDDLPRNALPTPYVTLCQPAVPV